MEDIKQSGRIKERIYHVIECPESSAAGRIFEISIMSLIMINVILVIADTFELPPKMQMISHTTETVSVMIFTAEYILRLWVCDLKYKDLSGLKCRIRYIFSFMAIIDLLAILPFYLPMVIKADLRVLRMLRIIRLFRVFKIGRYTTALNTIATVFKNKASQLISSMTIVFMLMLMAAVIMYNVEHDAQPDQFTNVFQAMWWAVATLTTVGYGDIYPVTSLGKLLSAVIAVLGIGFVAVPTGIITAGFSEIVDKDTENDHDDKNFCPYCGHKLD